MTRPKFLNATQEKHLQQLLLERDNPQVQRRIKMLLLRHEGKTYREISQLLGCSPRTVAYWCTSADPDDFDSLRDGRKQGNHHKVTEEYVSLLLEATEIPPEKLGQTFKQWTLDKLASYLAQQTGIQLSREQVRRILKRKNDAI
jgi:transposase